MTTPIDVRPFRGIRYNLATIGGDLGRVVAPPYDVISPEQQESLYEISPHNVVRLEYPRGGAGDERYRSAAAALKAWRESGVLRQDEQAAFYLVRHRFPTERGPRERFELLAAVRLAPWSDGAVLPHEHTAEGPKKDRLELMRSCRANLSPIMALYSDSTRAVAAILEAIAASPPVESFESIDGDAFSVWLITDKAGIDAVRASLAGPLYVADGHHRYETALRYREEAGDEAADFIMASLTALEDPGLVSLPYHRLLQRLPLDAQGRLDRQMDVYFVSERVPLTGTSPDEAAALFDARIGSGERPLIGVVQRGEEDTLRLLRPVDKGTLAGLMPGRSDGWSELSPCLFSDVLLGPALHGASQQDAEAQGYLAYTRDAAAAIAAVRARTQDMAFLLDGVPLQTMTAVAKAGERLPHKSTYFHPKLATGLVLKSLEGRLDDE